MRIAITQRHLQSASGQEKGEGISRSWHQWLGETGPATSLHPIPNVVAQLDSWWSAVKPDALILTGGENVGNDPVRDDTEFMALERFAGTLPILGVCRGAQLLNVWSGGRVTRESTSTHAGTTHAVHLTQAAYEHGLSFDRTVMVNSYHSNVIRAEHLGEDLDTLAEHADGTVEAFRSRVLPMVGLMWHPERRSAGETNFDPWLRSFLSMGTRNDHE